MHVPKLSAFALSALFALGTASLIPRTEPNTPESYTLCYPDRGYTKGDAFEALQDLTTRVIYNDEFPMNVHDCVFSRVNSTMVSVCNGNHRNRTITRDEVVHGVEWLSRVCGAGGTFNGVKVHNNLTFAVYGIYGGVNLAIPPGAAQPDLPGGVSILADVENTCPGFAYNGIPNYNCQKVECGEPNPQNNCQVYCEVRRTGFLGQEAPAPGIAGQLHAKGIEVAMTKGSETTITSGFSIGVEGILKETIGAGISYQYSVAETKVSSVELSAVEGASAQYQSRWVYFPKMVENCGTIKRQTLGVEACSGIACQPGYVGAPECTGDVEILSNVCTLAPAIGDDGGAMVYYVLRYESPGQEIPFKEQPIGYQDLCAKKTDKNSAGDFECKPVPELKGGVGNNAPSWFI